MRGADTFTESLFLMKQLDDFVPADHPLRAIREMVNKALVAMDELFAGMYKADIKGGRPSIAPEKLLRAMLLQVLYSVWLGQSGGSNGSGDGAGTGKSQSDVCADDDWLQPHAHAHLGVNPSAGGVRGIKSPEMGSQVSQGE